MVKQLHIICRKDEETGHCLNLQQTNPARDIWTSGNWLFAKQQDVDEVMNGYLFLHNTKAEPAHFCGRILSYTRIVDNSFKRPNRVVFTVERLPMLSAMDWQGQAHKASWTGRAMAFDEDEIYIAE